MIKKYRATHYSRRSDLAIVVAVWLAGWGLAVLMGFIILAATSAHALEIASENPGISSNAHWRNWPDLRLGDPAEFPAYAIHVGNEPVYAPTFAGSTFRLPVDHPYYKYAFVPLPNGLFQFQMALDRTAGDAFEKLFFGPNDSFRSPAPIDSHTGVSLNLVGTWEPASGNHAQRIVIGAGVRWNGRMNWVELNPYAHNFDWCAETNRGNPDGLPAGTCDTAGIYDRRSFFGGEIVEYSVPGLGNYPPLVPRAGWTRYWIDWGELIRSYPWQRPPADWADAEIVGVYVGIESIGRTWAYVQVRDFVTVTLGD